MDGLVITRGCREKWVFDFGDLYQQVCSECVLFFLQILVGLLITLIPTSLA